MKNELAILVDNLSGMIEAKIELLKLDLKEDASRAIASAVVYLILFSLGVGFFFFVNFTLAIYLSAFFENEYLGFAIVSGLYLFLFVLIWLLYKNEKVKNYIDNFVFRMFDMKHGK